MWKSSIAAVIRLTAAATADRTSVPGTETSISFLNLEIISNS